MNASRPLRAFLVTAGLLIAPVPGAAASNSGGSHHAKSGAATVAKTRAARPGSQSLRYIIYGGPRRRGGVRYIIFGGPRRK